MNAPLGHRNIHQNLFTNIENAIEQIAKIVINIPPLNEKNHWNGSIFKKICLSVKANSSMETKRMNLLVRTP